MEFLDNALVKAKEVFDVACEKTNEVVSSGKQKFDVASIESKRSKDFERLGKLYFDMIKDSEIENSKIKEIVNEIKEKNQKIEEIKKEINNIKNKRICPSCGAAIDKYSVFCNLCGAKLEFGSEENE